MGKEVTKYIKNSTDQENRLYEALRIRGVDCKKQFYDGAKTIDISIVNARLDIEVNGYYHYTNARQIKSDLDRIFWSRYRDDYDTLQIPNEAVDKNLDKVADAITIEVNRKIEEDKKRKNILYLFKLIIFIIRREIKYKRNRIKR